MKNLILLISVFVSFNLMAQDRIIGGQKITGDQVPWQLSLKSRFGSHFCGAALIEKDVLLTAAHCV
ncbi:MAG: trypsin-like serine protease, partial [Pseudomonadota bacterium]